MVGYKHPCRFCDQFIPSGSSTCPLCGKENPLGPLRCPQCQSPVQKNWQKCNNCGQALAIECPFCHLQTFFGEYCQHCATRLLVTCTDEKCAQEQPPLSENCIACGKPITSQVRSS